MNVNFSAFFILVLSSGFFQFNPRLAIKLSNIFNFTPDFIQLGAFFKIVIGYKFLQFNP
jgi:hypothetical protein